MSLLKKAASFVAGKAKEVLYDKFSGQDHAQTIVVRKKENNKAAILFIHGFGGDASGTWGQFPTFVKDDESLTGWDIYSLGYNTSLFPDIQGIWATNPDVTALAGYLRTMIVDRFSEDYNELAIIAHSMGGLVTQRAILDLIKSTEEDDLIVHSVVLFGTPSCGLKNAKLGRGIHKQVTDMAAGSPFITNLREEWDELVGDSPSFKFLTCAGDLDDFVPPISSLEPFDVKFHKRVNGNHVDIVKPASNDHISYKVVRKILLDDQAFYQGKWDSAEIALEMGDFQRAKRKLEGDKDDLGPQQIVQYAFALEATGEHDAAVQYLKDQVEKTNDTDIVGTLAGRWKRSYLTDLKPSYAQNAITLYKEAYDTASENENVEQVFYHAINLAFLNFKLKNYKDAKAYAKTAKENAEKSTLQDIWKYATTAEAYLYLDDAANAYYHYLIALEKNPTVREKESMYIQWLSILHQKGLGELEGRLRRLFREGWGV